MKHSRQISTETYRQEFWLGLYNHYMPKRTVVWSNSPVIRFLDKGPLSRLAKSVRAKMKRNSSKKGYVQYRDAKGQRKTKGSSQLKRSQCLGCTTPVREICKLLLKFWDLNPKP